MTFKDQVQLDIGDVFFNFDEFATLHKINGKQMLAIVDDNEIIDREKRYNHVKGAHGDGVYLREKLVYVKAEDFGGMPAALRVLDLDGKTYRVVDTTDEVGVYTITLEANRT